jgi:hypothetical protein
MNTIKLEEIVGYLPYGLKVLHQCNVVMKMTAERQSGDFLSIESVIDGFGKPLLHKIESLTEFREDLGFMPIEDLLKRYRMFELINGEFFSKNYGKFCKISDIPYGIIQRFYEWHIDIHNLIPRNLAIDAKTLKL